VHENVALCSVSIAETPAVKEGTFRSQSSRAGLLRFHVHVEFLGFLLTGCVMFKGAHETLVVETLHA
jgi:hypothetical protein